MKMSRSRKVGLYWGFVVTAVTLGLLALPAAAALIVFAAERG